MKIIYKFKNFKKQNNQFYRKLLRSFIEGDHESFDENLVSLLNQKIISLEELKTTLIYLMLFKEPTTLGKESLDQIESILLNPSDSNIRKILNQSISPHDLNIIPVNYTHSFEKISLKLKIFKKIFPLTSDYPNKLLSLTLEEKIKICLNQKITIELIYYLLVLIDLFQIDPTNLYKIISLKIIQSKYFFHDVNILKLKKDYPNFLNILKTVLENPYNDNNSSNNILDFIMPEIKEKEKEFSINLLKAISNCESPFSISNSSDIEHPSTFKLKKNTFSITRFFILSFQQAFQISTYEEAGYLSLKLLDKEKYRIIADEELLKRYIKADIQFLKKIYDDKVKPFYSEINEIAINELKDYIE